MPSLPLLAGRYRLQSQIAAGGVGEVWRAEDTLLTRPVAVKLLRAELAGHTETLARFRAEARHAGALSHPAIAVCSARMVAVPSARAHHSRSQSAS